MNTKFTKGEWIVYDKNDDWGNVGSDELVVGMSSYNKDYTNYYCSHKITIDDSEDEARANAHLIAAAPDMYAMIKELVHELNLAIDECNEYKIKAITSSTENEPDYIDKQTLHEAQILLAKARGEI